MTPPPAEVAPWRLREAMTPVELVVHDLTGAAAVLLAEMRNGESEDQALGVLAMVDTVRRSMDGWTSWWVAEAREHGASWGDVAQAIGVTKQSAWHRFGVASTEAPGA